MTQEQDAMPREHEDLNVISETWGGFNRQIVFRPAFDRRHTDPSKDYGIHGVELQFYLIGEIGAVQFTLFTNWQLKHVQREQDSRVFDRNPHLLCHPMPADLGYHSPVPMYEGHTSIGGGCHLLGIESCYYDGSGLMAEPVYWSLVEQGPVAVWNKLMDFYKERFSDIPRFEAVSS